MNAKIVRRRVVARMLKYSFVSAGFCFTLSFAIRVATYLAICLGVYVVAGLLAFTPAVFGLRSMLIAVAMLLVLSLVFNAVAFFRQFLGSRRPSSSSTWRAPPLLVSVSIRRSLSGSSTSSSTPWRR